MKKTIEYIAFDADDTLWENELYFQEFEKEFCNLLSPYQMSSSISEDLFKVEMKNLHMYGYGLKSMMLSMIETICKVTEGEGNIGLVNKIIELGQELLQRPVTLLNGVKEVLSAFQGKYKLVLATKGDLFDQQRKIANSGLQEYFTHIEIMSDKKKALVCRSGKGNAYGSTIRGVWLITRILYSRKLPKNGISCESREEANIHWYWRMGAGYG